MEMETPQETLSDAHKSRGNELFRKGCYNEALEEYTAGIDRDPENAILYSNRSITYCKVKSFDNALSDASRCIELDGQWSKGYIRKISSLEGLCRDEDIMETAAVGFKTSKSKSMKAEFVERWLSANQRVNKLLADSIDLPRGILVLSRGYHAVLSVLIRSLRGEQPLDYNLLNQCLYTCSEEIEHILEKFGKLDNSAIKEWMKHLPHQFFSYQPSRKAELEKGMDDRSRHFVEFLKAVDSTLYPILRPVFGLVVLVILNRSNIVCEMNSDHHSAEFMNRSLLPLFENSILHTIDYHSMYIGRLCAILDSFIGRSYALVGAETALVRKLYLKVEEAIESYPKSLPKNEFVKDKQLAEATLNNIRVNILLPRQSTATADSSKELASLPMTVEIAERLVREEPERVKSFLSKHCEEIDSVEYLTVRDVEDLISMTGIYLDLNDQVSAKEIFGKGEKAFFRVLGHLLSNGVVTLDNCSSVVAPIRQLVLHSAFLLEDIPLFLAVALRWKGMLTEFRSILIQAGLGTVFGQFYQWNIEQTISTSVKTDQEIEDAIVDHMKKEEVVLREYAAPILQAFSELTHLDIEQVLHSTEAVLDYVFYVPLHSDSLMKATCILYEKGRSCVCELDFNKIRRMSAVVKDLLGKSRDALEPKQFNARFRAELALLSPLLFPEPVQAAISSGRLSNIYISLASEIVFIPLDLLLIGEDKYLSQFVHVSILSSTKDLLHSKLRAKILPQSIAAEQEGPCKKECCIVANPNFDLQDSVPDMALLSKLLCSLGQYLNVSENSKHIHQLEFSMDEAGFVAHCLESVDYEVSILSGDNATLSSVLALNNPMVLHIASHAYSSYERTAYRGSFLNDLDAAIALAGYNTFASKNFTHLHPKSGIGQLPALAVCCMKLNKTKLVFLSTCVSAGGSFSSQESVNSLVEAFRSAGAETVIATQWVVQDETASLFSKYFYDKLRLPGVRPSEALSYAKNCFQQDTSLAHWVHWACFTCYGLDNPL